MRWRSYRRGATPFVHRCTGVTVYVLEKMLFLYCSLSQHASPNLQPTITVGTRMVLQQSRRKQRGAGRRTDTANSYHGTTSFPIDVAPSHASNRSPLFFKFSDCSSVRCFTHRNRLTNAIPSKSKPHPVLACVPFVRRSSPPALRRWRCCCRAASRRTVRTIFLQQQATAVSWRAPRAQK